MDQNKTGIKLDRISFQLGMINCFVEMVACGVKKLALSPPLLPQDYLNIQAASEDIVQGFDILSYLEKSLLLTDLQTEDFTRGKWSILYYRDKKVLEEYFALKEEKQLKQQAGEYGVQVRKNISWKFMRLLGYPERVIEEKLSRAEPSSP